MKNNLMKGSDSGQKLRSPGQKLRCPGQKLRWLRLSKPLFFLALSISLILLGIYREEAECVIEKATKICMECIGIG